MTAAGAAGGWTATVAGDRRDDGRVRGALMVCGTASDVGKSHVVAGLCRALARRGVAVAPFKGQNMALNSVVAADGAEIGRAQAMQAAAAGVPPEAAMNPVLLKPTGDRASQVVVMGRPWRTMDATTYDRAKDELVGIVTGALADLRRRFDVVVCEGAGSPAEINLLDRDVVNLGLAARAGIPAIVVGDIDRGGVFAHLYGTVALLPDELRRRVRGFVVNKFRGDPAVLAGATATLEERTGLPTFGVLPYVDELWLDAEDSMALEPAAWGRIGAAARTPGAGGSPAAPLDVAVVRWPRIANFTDVDPLAAEPGVAVRLVEHAGALGDPDVVILPGTKATVGDLGWFRDRGLAAAVAARRASGTVVVGVCGGCQMLGSAIADPDGIEAEPGMYDGLGWLPVRTTFTADKRTVRRSGVASAGGEPVTGYEIHHGQPAPTGGSSWFVLDGGEPEGAVDEAGGVFGTSVHGVFESDGFRRAFLSMVAERRGRPWAPSTVSFEALRHAQIDRLADACEARLDLDRLWAVAAEARPPQGSD
jgi:adenosylcobyric acid synthase